MSLHLDPDAPFHKDTGEWLHLGTVRVVEFSGLVCVRVVVFSMLGP